MVCLPIESEIRKLSRAYLANVIYTVVGEPFKQWVDARVEERNFKVASQKNMFVEMDPEVHKVFRQSTAVPCKCWLGCYLRLG